jgi:hypothetical protein
VYVKIFYNIPFIISQDIELSKIQFIPIVFVTEQNFDFTLNYFFKKRKSFFLEFEKNFPFKKLNTLLEIILSFKRIDVKIGFINIPYCVLKSLLGNFYFSIFSEEFLLKKSNFFFKFKPKKLFFLPICNFCLDYNRCFSLGENKENYTLWDFRTSFRKIKHSYDSKNETLQQFINHIDLSQTIYTDRNISLTKTFKKAQSINDNRFIYYCHFLKKSEFTYEFNFLDSYFNNSKLYSIIKQKYLNLELKGMAFSFKELIDSKIISYYLFFVNLTLLEKYVKSVITSFKKEQFEELYFIGFDEIDNKISQIKLYSKVQNSNDIYEYLGIQKFPFSHENMLLVRRFDGNGEFKEYKIECMSNDYENVMKYLLDKGFNINFDFTKNTITRIAFSFSKEMDLNKVVFYYHPYRF